MNPNDPKYKHVLRSKAKMTVGEFLRTQRKRVGLTQKGLADRMGYKTSTIGHTEIGTQLPSPEFMANAMDVIADILVEKGT